MRLKSTNTSLICLPIESQENNNNDSNNTDLILGIVVGSVGIIGIAIVIGLVFYHRKAK